MTRRNSRIWVLSVTLVVGCATKPQTLDVVCYRDSDHHLVKSSATWTTRSHVDGIVPDQDLPTIPAPTGGLDVAVRFDIQTSDESAKKRLETAAKLAQAVILSPAFKKALIAKGNESGVPGPKGFNAIIAQQCPYDSELAACQVQAVSAHKAGLRGAQQVTVGVNSNPFRHVATANTALGGDSISVHKWWINCAPLYELAGTLVHEWLHTLGWPDPDRAGDLASLVYGTEEDVQQEAIAILLGKPQWADVCATAQSILPAHRPARRLASWLPSPDCHGCHTGAERFGP